MDKEEIFIDGLTFKELCEYADFISNMGYEDEYED